MAVGEIFLAAFLEVLLHRLVPREILTNFGRLRGGGKKLGKWKGMLYGIASVLNDAEEKQLTNKDVEQWLDDLEDLAYDVDDVLDKFSTEMLRRKAKEQTRSRTTSKVRGLIPKLKFKFNVRLEVEEITHRLQEISERKDMLGLKYIGTPSAKARKRPPSSYASSGLPVIGRDDDKAKIIEFLSKDEPSSVNFDVIAIVGMPGVGKTALAQLVLNENRDAQKEFNPKVWVSVSDEFDLLRITKAILESVTAEPCQLEEFNSIQERLSKVLVNKKFLLILDDVWNTCDYELWERLRSPFRAGAPGSKIIVTTRDAKVARTVGATEVHDLQCISNDDCWKVFVQHGSLSFNNVVAPDFGFLREKIVARCSGLPLAARTLGGLLGCKEIDEWEEILNNSIWNPSGEEGDILPVLKLSYHYLPSNLKRCFAYCSILPNDYEFGEMQLILLWMAEGLLQVPGERKEMEDIGADYFGELLSRSLFQKSSKDNSTYVMHDLVGDLARSVLGEIYFRLEDKLDHRCSLKTRHSSYILGKHDGVIKFEAFKEATHLRTFLPLTLSKDLFNFLTCKVTLDLLPRMEYLRVLSLNGYRIMQLPDSIGKVKHLRYLDLTHTEITSLPESISTLHNLQTLILDHCSHLKALPTNLRNLSNLRHLNNSNVPALEVMPAELGRLTNLQTLQTFVVGKESGLGISEIGGLLQLRGTLHLSRLENVLDVQDAMKANFVNKDGLDELVLEWSDKKDMKVDVLDSLQPHQNLQVLTITRYGGLKFSPWVGDPLFTNMVLVRLEGCNECQFLPPLGQLPSLKELYVRGMSAVENVGIEFYGESNLPFPLLESLTFSVMHNWKEWFPCKRDQTEAFPCLKMLSISSCPKLEGSLPENLDLLSKLDIYGCEQLVVSIASYQKLCELSIRGCKEVVHRSGCEFELLEAIKLSGILGFKLQTEGFLRGLANVKSLDIGDCEELTSSWKNEKIVQQYLTSLHKLIIRGKSHSQFVHDLTSLQQLHIYDCPSLISFQELGFPPSLTDISVGNCSSFVHFARHQIPPKLRRISITSCKNLKSLIEEEEVEGSSFSSPSFMHEETSCLQDLVMIDCPSVASLSFRGHLPRSLKRLLISGSKQLESIADTFNDNTCLEDIDLQGCSNLKYLPDGLCHLTNLQRLWIRDCGNLVSVARGGYPTSNLKEIVIVLCDKLEAVPKGMHNLVSLQSLMISYSESFASSLEEGFPPNLISLHIHNLKSCKLLVEWGLHRLTSLRVLSIDGEDPDVVSFPLEKFPEMLLPKSLIEVHISNLPNLMKLGAGIQLLTSLVRLDIWGCPKLASMEKEGLPLSVTQLSIHGSPILEERCKPGSKGRYWPCIARIPFMHIGDWNNTRSPS